MKKLCKKYIFCQTAPFQKPVRRLCLLRIIEQPEQFEVLTTALWNRIQRFKADDLSHIPPMLLRREGEKVGEWLNRCYNAGGYIGGM